MIFHKLFWLRPKFAKVLVTKPCKNAAFILLQCSKFLRSSQKKHIVEKVRFVSVEIVADKPFWRRNPEIQFQWSSTELNGLTVISTNWMCSLVLLTVGQLQELLRVWFIERNNLGKLIEMNRFEPFELLYHGSQFKNLWFREIDWSSSNMNDS